MHALGLGALEAGNWALIACALFYLLLCVFSVVTGALYLSGRRKLNPLELPDSLATRLEAKGRLELFARAMGAVTIVVGLVQGAAALAILRAGSGAGYALALGFTLFSIASASLKLRGKFSVFPLLKLVAYAAITVVLLLGGSRRLFLGSRGTLASAQADYAAVQVSYLGPEGTYTQEACTAFFGGAGSYLPMDDVATSVQALIDGEVDYAVIPQENTIGGPIPEYLDEVVTNDQVSIAGEVELPINQNLLAHPGATLDDIHTVYSHKQGIAQGSAWLAEHLPEAEVIEVSSTAEGARRAAEAEGGDCAAIGSAAAAEVYGLNLLAEGIQQSEANKTRFYVLTLAEPEREQADRMAYLASGDASDLAELLTSTEAEGLEVIAVHDRPEKTELGRYTYLVECSGGGFDAYERLVEHGDPFTFRYLGSFPVR